MKQKNITEMSHWEARNPHRNALVILFMRFVGETTYWLMRFSYAIRQKAKKPEPKDWATVAIEDWLMAEAREGVKLLLAKEMTVEQWIESREVKWNSGKHFTDFDSIKLLLRNALIEELKIVKTEHKTKVD